MAQKKRVLLSWSSGKDSAWAFYRLKRTENIEIVGLLTTFNSEFNRVSMHGVRRELVELQSQRLGVELWSVELPWPCSNAIYEEKMRQVIELAKSRGIEAIAFGDLFLEDIKKYRVRQLSGTGLEPLFPVWTSPDKTSDLALELLDLGFKATLVCVDPRKVPPEFSGLEFDKELLKKLPDGVDRCGENGEFHTFCWDSPDFSAPIEVAVGERVNREGFEFCDLLPAG